VIAWLIAIALKPFVLGFSYSKGGRVPGMAKGGPVFPSFAEYAQGFASGGSAQHHPRPAGISPLDTVAAWLQPGEYVIPKAIVDLFGVDFFERIRAGWLNPDSAANILAMRVQAHQGVYGMAGGGQVAQGSSSSSQGGNGGNSVQILPVMVASDATVDQMLSGGRKAFGRMVNDVTGGGRNSSRKRW
jgi:hypothetical protein